MSFPVLQHLVRFFLMSAVEEVPVKDYELPLSKAEVLEDGLYIKSFENCYFTFVFRLVDRPELGLKLGN